MEGRGVVWKGGDGVEGGGGERGGEKGRCGGWKGKEVTSTLLL